ncbi:hypothetical protein SK128_003919 [Halocaridina rubra]|uniref:RING-type domain-containing protein n=1 Tax=Halocaridina rubra TaxID=373956 RepID=A0AAN8XM18_HALRR
MDPDVITCLVCMELYSNHRQPRNLHCGHSLCTACLAAVLLNNKECPECRSDLSSSASALSYPVGYQLLRIASQYHENPNHHNEAATTSPKKKSLPDVGDCESHGSKLFFRCMPCQKWVCRDCVTIEHSQKKVKKCKILNITEALKEIKKIRLEEMQSAMLDVERANRNLNNVAKSFHKRKDASEKKLADLQHKLEMQQEEVINLESKCQSVISKIEELKNFRLSLEEKKCSLRELNNHDDVIAASNEIEAYQLSISSALEDCSAFNEYDIEDAGSFVASDDDSESSHSSHSRSSSSLERPVSAKKRKSRVSSSSSSEESSRSRSSSPKRRNVKRRTSSRSKSSSNQKRSRQKRIETSDEERSYDSSPDIDELHMRTSVSVKQFLFS